MPLTLSMTNAKIGLNGKIIIDRNNLVFCYSKNTPLSVRIHGGKLRDLNSTLITHLIKLMQPLTDPMANIDDPRHVVLDHVSEFDKATVHDHFILNQTIDMSLMDKIMQEIPRSVWLSFIDEETYRDLLTVPAQYFHDMQYTKLHADCNIQYEEEKKSAYKKMTAEMGSKFETSDIRLEVCSDSWEVEELKQGSFLTKPSSPSLFAKKSGYFDALKLAPLHANYSLQNQVKITVLDEAVHNPGPKGFILG